MKMRNMKKKLLSASLALAMVVTSTTFRIPHIHGESDKERVPKVVKESEVVKKEEEVKTAVKAFLTDQNKVTGRTTENTSDGTDITDLGTITDLMVGDTVTSIATDRFKDLKKLTTLTFKSASEPVAGGGAVSKVTTIGANAFKGTGITNVIFPANLATIEQGAFADTVALSTIDFTHSKNVENIKQGAFENSGLTSVNLSPINASTKASLKLGENTFKGNKKLASATLSTKIEYLDDGVFAGTKLTAIEIVAGIIYVGSDAFRGTPLTTLTVNTANENFLADKNVLYNKTKTSLLLYPEGLSATEFTIPNTVTAIRSSAFGFAPSLTKVILGQAVEEIDQEAFTDATKLATLDLRNAQAIKTVGARAFLRTALNSMIIGETTGPLSAITAEAFHSTATNRTVSFLDDSDVAIKGVNLIGLVKKYKDLKKPENGAWKFNAKFATPTASVEYDTMQLKNLEPSAVYTIQGNEYTANAQGKIDVLKEWGGTKISIVRKSAFELNDSDAQELSIDKLYGLTVDGKESLKKAGTAIAMTALEKPNHVFTKWAYVGVENPTLTEKKISFTMPEKDVTLTSEYKEINVETPVAQLFFDGSKDVVVTITSALTNFEKLTVNNKDLRRDSDYTVSGTDTTILTLKQIYLKTLQDTTQFSANFKEGGGITFQIRLYGSAPIAIANYDEMKLTGLEANTQYKINNALKTADAQGKIRIEKAWGNTTIAIVKVGTGEKPDSKPQKLDIEALYTIRVDGKEIRFTTEGTSVKVSAKHKEGYKFTGWAASGVVLPDTMTEEITFNMPANDVVLTTTYTQIITTKPEEMVYDGTNEVIVRFNIPMNEFKDIEYNGQKLTKNVDYIVTSGSTIITFTKTFLDKMKGDITGIKALFTNDSVVFTIKHATVVPPTVNPSNPSKPTNPSKPALVEKPQTKSPNTGDTTNRFLVFVIMLVSAGAMILVNRKKQAK